MEESARLKYLKIALVLIGAFCVVGVYPLTIYWPSGWAWHTDGPSLYLQMILGIYATLGVFLIMEPGILLSISVSFGSWSGQALYMAGLWRFNQLFIHNIEAI